MSRSSLVALFLSLLLAAAEPTTKPSTRPSSEELAEPAFWLERASLEWAQIADARSKPWKEMVEQQFAADDDAGLKRTLAELKALVPRLQQAANRDYSLTLEYVGHAG